MNKPIASATKIFSLLGSNGYEMCSDYRCLFLSPENLSFFPPLRKHMPWPDHLRMNILLIPTPVSFFFPSSFSVPCSPRGRGRLSGRWGKHSFQCGPLSHHPADQLLPAAEGWVRFSLHHSEPLQSEGRKVAGHLPWTFPNLGLFGSYSNAFFAYGYQLGCYLVSTCL